jgi:polysaccharide export outer membrane protein
MTGQNRQSGIGRHNSSGGAIKSPAVNRLLRNAGVGLVGRKPALSLNPKTGFSYLVRLLVCLLLSLSAAACAPGRGLPDLPPIASSTYRLGPSDVVRLITFGEDSLSGEFRVSDSGTIALPLLGSITASGLSPDALASRVADALTKANLLRAPSVTAEVIAYRPIFVLGEVSKPGQYPYQPGMTMVTAAAVAGGFTYRAIPDYASVVRTRDGIAIEGKATRQSFVQPGDVITVFERKF